MADYAKQLLDVLGTVSPIGAGVMGIQKLMKKPDGTTETVGPEELVPVTPISKAEFNGITPEDLTEEQLQLLLNAKKKQAARAKLAKTQYAQGPLTSAPTVGEMLTTPGSRRSPEVNADIIKEGITKESALLDTLAMQPNLSPEERTRVRSMINQLRAKQGKAPVRY